MYCFPTTPTDTSIRQNRYSNLCGYTPIYFIDLIEGSNIRILPNEYTWVTSLEYNNDKNSRGICAGSVISSLYVISAAQCMVGRVVELYGEV